MESSQSKRPDLQKLKNEDICRWEQEIDNQKICVNIHSDFCGKKCNLIRLKKRKIDNRIIAILKCKEKEVNCFNYEK